MCRYCICFAVVKNIVNVLKYKVSDEYIWKIFKRLSFMAIYKVVFPDGDKVTAQMGLNLR